MTSCSCHHGYPRWAEQASSWHTTQISPNLYMSSIFNYSITYLRQPVHCRWRVQAVVPWHWPELLPQGLQVQVSESFLSLLLVWMHKVPMNCLNYQHLWAVDSNEWNILCCGERESTEFVPNWWYWSNELSTMADRHWYLCSVKEDRWQVKLWVRQLLGTPTHHPHAKCLA